MENEKLNTSKTSSYDQNSSSSEEPPLVSFNKENLSIEPSYITKINDQIGFSKHSENFYLKNFPNSKPADWCDWRWQVKNSITTVGELRKFIELNGEEYNTSGNRKADSMPLRITPYYASLIAGEDLKSKEVRRSIVPTFHEMTVSDGESNDPLGEESHSPVPNIVHRYPDRVLFLVTGFCSTYCRYCTRTYMVAEKKGHESKKVWDQGIEYIRNHPEIRDVLMSGGDPITMPDEDLEYLLKNLRSIKHVEFLRIGTKVPVVLPQRITMKLCNMLKKYHPLFLSIHFTHPDELTSEVNEACSRLADAGIPLGSQTVLLKDINDDVETMKKLMQGLLRNRVRPYYIYQCDPILGSSHFRTPVSKGLEIIHGLRGHTTGYAVPHYVIDAPGGGGKIPLLPEYYLGKEGNDIILRNFEGNIFKYPDVI